MFHAFQNSSTEEDRLSNKEICKLAKKKARKAVAMGRNKAYKKLYDILETKDGERDMFSISKTRHRSKRDLGKVRCGRRRASTSDGSGSERKVEKLFYNKGEL